jgi:uncharacterized protein YdhG (YjbR/CyaY superfamily)
MKNEIDTYLHKLPKEEREILEELRQTIHSVVAFEECISYGMPAFKYKSKIVACFRMYKHHIGFYPYSGATLKNFVTELKKFKTSVGAVQFSKEEKLPKILIRKIIRARMKEIDSKTQKRLK